MAAKINTTKRIGGGGSNTYKAEPDCMMGGADHLGNYDGVKRRGGPSPYAGPSFGTARGIGGGAKTTSTNRDNDTDSM